MVTLKWGFTSIPPNNVKDNIVKWNQSFQITPHHVSNESCYPDYIRHPAVRRQSLLIAGCVWLNMLAGFYQMSCSSLHISHIALCDVVSDDEMISMIKSMDKVVNLPTIHIFLSSSCELMCAIFCSYSISKTDHLLWSGNFLSDYESWVLLVPVWSIFSHPDPRICCICS